jgi:hypothetical protein
MSNIRRQTLSVCYLAGSSVPATSALEVLRSVADELVVVVDSRRTEDQRRDEGLADEVFMNEAITKDGCLTWLHQRCRCDWMLWLDGDEIPTPEMALEISRVIDGGGAPELRSIAFARRNLVDSGARYVKQEPWYPDFQVRMVRAGALSLAGRFGAKAEAMLPGRLVEAPIYHLLFLLSSVDARRAYADQFEDAQPELRATTGLAPIDLLIPEHLSSLSTTATPAEHRDYVNEAIAATAVRGSVAIPCWEMDAFIFTAMF